MSLSVPMLIMPRTVHQITCRRGGQIIWEEESPNIVHNGGLDHILDVVFKSGTQIGTWYAGLKGSGTPAAADTMSSHASWSEDQNYSESVRQTLTLGSVSSQSVDNSASKATFTINATTTIHGVFVCSNSTKGGTSDF